MHCFARIGVLLIVTRCLKHNISDKFSYLNQGVKGRGVEHLSIPFFKCKGKTQTWSSFWHVFRIEFLQYKTILSGDHHQFFLLWWCLRRSKWSTWKLSEVERTHIERVWSHGVQRNRSVSSSLSSSHSEFPNQQNKIAETVNTQNAKTVFFSQATATICS